MNLPDNAPTMELRTLESTTADARYEAFERAFADYDIKLGLTPAQLAEMHVRRGVRHDLSVGAFDGETLVGFTFNGLGTFKGRTAGYDAGTGVVPSARGQRLASRMMHRSLELLKGAGANRYVLEVLQTNTVAFRVYEQLGFRVTRDFVYWSLDQVPATPRTDLAIETARSLDGVPADDMLDREPSWQNSMDSIARAREPKTVFLARVNGRLEGYAALFDSGDVPQIAVARQSRRRGIGTALVHAARGRSTRPLRFANIDAADTGTTRFLESLGASETVRQHEMELEL